MFLASRIQENPQTFYTFNINKRIARERAGPIKDKRENLLLEPEEVVEVLNEYFAPRRRAWMM